MPNPTTPQKVWRSVVAIILFVTAICLLLTYPIDAKAKNTVRTVDVLTNLQKFNLHARCARLAERAGLNILFGEHVKIVRVYKDKIGYDEGSIAYQVGYIDGSLDQMYRYKNGKYTTKAIAKIVYGTTCAANA